MIIAMPGETQQMYEKNLELLPPWIIEAVSAVSEEELQKKIEVHYNAQGYPVCLYCTGNGSFHITSEHPLEEAAAWAQLLQLQNSAEVFLYGCGFGYALFELFAQKPPHALVIVFEQDICLFKAMLMYFDFSELMQTQKVVFFVGNNTVIKNQLLGLFSTMLYDVTTFPTVIYTFAAARNFKNEYAEVHRCAFEELSFITSCLGNSHQDDMTGLRNLLANTKEVIKAPYLSSMKDKYRGVPAIIVSNGPSLDKSMPLLKEIQGRCLMICAESAIVPLTKNGIKPDIMAALERTKKNYLFHFENQNHSPDIALFALTMVDPHVFPSFAGEKIPIFRKGEVMSRWFNQHLADGSELDAGASVAHLAVSSAIYLGADPIIFVGQDLAYGLDGGTHSKDAVTMQDKGKAVRDIIHSFPTVYVEGNDGEMIPSNQLWVNFKIIMESIISKNPEHHFYNATEGGAKIHGTERAKLSALVERFCAEPIPYRVTELIAQEREKVSLAERTGLLEKLIADIQDHAKSFRKLAHQTNMKRLECEKMIVLCAGKNEELFMEVLDETYQNNLLSFYQYNDDELCGFFSQRLLCSYFYLFNQLGAIDTQEKRTQIFDLHRQCFRDLRVIGQSLAVTFEEAVQPLLLIQQELTGKVV